MWRVKFEEKWFAPLKNVEAEPSRWAPEVQLVRVLFGRVEMEPVVLSDADVEFQGLRNFCSVREGNTKTVAST